MLYLVSINSLQIKFLVPLVLTLSLLFMTYNFNKAVITLKRLYNFTWYLKTEARVW